MPAAAFAALFAALYASHQVADYWVQTEAQACAKGNPGWMGRLACAAHVTTYTITQAVAVVAVWAVLDLDLTTADVAAGLLVSAATHYVADRRRPLRRLAELVGKDPVWLSEGGGLPLLDQSWHCGWLFVAALVMAA